MINSKIFIIAEAGINHNGDLSIAKQLIDMAVDAGCDAVKFQKRDPDVCVPQKMKNVMRETPWGEITYLEYKKRIEFGREEYDEIDRYCKKLGILWSASAWDLNSLEFLDKYDLPFHKVASALGTYQVFLEKVASRKILTYASVGMCNYDQIDNIVSVFNRYNCPLILLHTVSTYPAKESDLNLLMIKSLKDRYGLPVGYSGHEASVSPSIIASVIGAVVVERHITLDRAMWGTDHSASLELAGLKQLVNSIRKINVVSGDGVKREIPEEKSIASKMRYWEV